MSKYLFWICLLSSCAQKGNEKVESVEFYDNGMVKNIYFGDTNITKMVGFNSEGYKSQEATFVKGKLNGEYKYYSYGTLKHIQSFKAGMLHGPFVVYDLDCCHYPTVEGMMADNKREGLLLEYYHGVVKLIELYSADKLVKTVYRNDTLNEQSPLFDESRVPCECIDKKVEKME